MVRLAFTVFDFAAKVVAWVIKALVWTGLLFEIVAFFLYTHAATYAAVQGELVWAVIWIVLSVLLCLFGVFWLVRNVVLLIRRARKARQKQRVLSMLDAANATSDETRAAGKV